MSASLPKAMQAALLEQTGGPAIAGQVTVPRPGRGQVLVRMAASPINPSDLGFIRGSYGFQRPFPVVPGFEGSGVVVAAGPGLLPRLWAGRRVAFSSPQGGAWAEYLVTEATSCVPLVKKVSFEQGAMLFINPMTAMAFFNMARRGRHAAMVSNAAASALGRMILRLGQIHHIPIIHIVRRPEQVELLRSLGGEYILNSSDPEFQEQLRAVARQLKATLILDPVAGEQTQQLLEAAPQGSTVVVYGSLSGKRREVASPSPSNGDKQITGFFLPDWAASHPVQALVNMVRVQGLVGRAFQTSIQKRFPLAQVQDAIALYQKNPTAGKVLIVADSGKVGLD
jgi:NADPH2:quinone reductase